MAESAKITVEEITLPENKVLASPTRKFFVQMLTRDIDLMDAIMDLIDNCIDGVHRENKIGNKKNIYKGYHAEIILNNKEFIIKDNCGGIPEDIARKRAFKMGRDDEHQKDENLETVGVYGIGMKRAIFKIGLEAMVVSHHADDTFKVTIPKEWSSLKGDWYFDFSELTKKEAAEYVKTTGTYIAVTHLHENIVKQFGDKSGFIKNLQRDLKKHYGYIISQGFKIKVNGVDIPPIKLEIITTSLNESKKSIRPYAYTAELEGVSIEITVGFYRPPAEPEEIDEQLDGAFAKSTSENAGVTVLCNDRVVLFANKDYITGWGDGAVPQYHTQFINIAGVVHFRSNTPVKLPVTTTKRGLDTSSYVYNFSKQRIKEGLKIFTDFTNRWKSPSEERTALFRSAQRINALEPGNTKSALLALSKKKKGDEGMYQIPDLPRPDDAIRERMVSISFTKEKEKVEKMKNHFFEGANKPASEIGSWCFDKMYSQIR